MEYDWYCTMWLKRSNKAAGGVFVILRVMSEPAGRKETYSMTSDAC
jgi:hypothetical protein